jgi:hypothetical protein
MWLRRLPNGRLVVVERPDQGPHDPADEVDEVTMIDITVRHGIRIEKWRGRDVAS